MTVGDYHIRNMDLQNAVAEGVDRAISRLIHGITDMPSADFWDILETSMTKAFERVAEELIQYKINESQSQYGVINKESEHVPL